MNLGACEWASERTNEHSGAREQKEWAVNDPVLYAYARSFHGLFKTHIATDHIKIHEMDYATRVATRGFEALSYL